MLVRTGAGLRAAILQQVLEQWSQERGEVGGGGFGERGELERLPHELHAGDERKDERGAFGGARTAQRFRQELLVPLVDLGAPDFRGALAGGGP